MVFDGQKVTRRNPRELQRLGVSFVPNSPMENALTAEGTISENLTLVNPEDGISGGLLWQRLEGQVSLRVMEQLSIRATGPRQSIKTLSAGDKQKVSLSSWM